MSQTRREIMIEELASEVLEGTFGNGDERIYRLGRLYDPVQRKVSQYISERRRARPRDNHTGTDRTI